MRETTVRLQKAIEGVGAGLNNREPALEVPLLVRVERGIGDLGTQGAGDGFNRGERVVEFVAENANQALPCAAFLFAQSSAYV